MSKYFSFWQMSYINGWVTLSQVQQARDKELITAAEYMEITGRETYITQEEELKSADKIPISKNENGTSNEVIDMSKIEEEIKAKIIERMIKAF